ncbi:hypothetical protein SprV_0301302300 [Sparganum proliferum]
MGLFGHMRIHEGAIGCSFGTPSTSCKSTVPSSANTPSPSTLTTISFTTLSTYCTPTIPSPTPTLSPNAFIISSSTTATISETDTNVAEFSVHTVPAHSPHTSAWSVTCESIAQRLANQHLGHRNTFAASASTALTAPAHSPNAWAHCATCASTTTTTITTTGLSSRDWLKTRPPVV